MLGPAQEPTLNVMRALLLLPLFVLVFDERPSSTGATANAAWGWGMSMKV